MSAPRVDAAGGAAQLYSEIIEELRADGCICQTGTVATEILAVSYTHLTLPTICSV